MRRRFLALTGVAVAIIVMIVVLKLSAAATDAPSFRTPWGDPDLQGIWTDLWQAPLERPAVYRDKTHFTEEERAELDRKRANIPRMGDRKVQRGTETSVSGAYNGVFLPLRPTGPRTSLIVDPQDGKVPSLTPEARKRRDEMRAFQLALMRPTETCKSKDPACASGTYGPPSPRRFETPPHYVASNINRVDGPEDRSLGERCMRATLPDFGGVVGLFQEIIQTRDTVAIFYDTGQGQGWQRIIPVSNRPHLPAHVRQWAGDSRARWEGNTLVVEVTNFSPKTDWQGSREDLRLIERWTRINEKQIDYVVTLEDPTTWTRSWTIRQDLTRQSDQANRIYKEPRCHEGNYGLVGLLWGARVAEKEFAQGRGPDPATRCVSACGGGGGDDEEVDPLAARPF
jgi:hypothetical protein